MCTIVIKNIYNNKNTPKVFLCLYRKTNILRKCTLYLFDLFHVVSQYNAISKSGHYFLLKLSSKMKGKYFYQNQTSTSFFSQVLVTTI